jgi:hypothetical protein
MSSRLRRVVHIVNLPKHICKVALGADHPIYHRLTAGAGFMVVGVLVSKIPFAYETVRLVFDGIGYFIHGLGSVPFVELLLSEEKPKSGIEFPMIGEENETSSR